MTICILGATGRTGKHLLKEALARGHDVRVLVRDPARIGYSHDRLEVLAGTPADVAVLKNALSGCVAVLSALNISRSNDFPWSPLRTPRDFLSTTMRAIIALAPGSGLQRIIFTSAWGVAETECDIPAWFRWLIHNSNIGPAYRDHALQEKIVAESVLKWTAVRPAALMNGKRIQKVRISVGNHPRPGLFINRISVAAFMLDCLEQELFVNQAPVISA